MTRLTHEQIEQSGIGMLQFYSWELGEEWDELMASNEHPDMSGNPCDMPFLCAHCEREFREEDAYGIPGNDELLFCSNDCAVEYVDDRMHHGEL